MKKRILVTIACALVFFSLKAQQVHHKIVFDITSADTAVQARVLHQFSNVLNLAPDAELELVCHGSAITMLVKSKTLLEQQMKDLMSKGKVAFKACANSMKRMGIDKSQLVTLADVVPMAILELSAKQQEGWSYLWVSN